MRPGPLAINAKAAAAATALALALAAVPAGASPNGAAERFYERSFVLAADARCRLFEPRLTHALEAATWQARGAALRAGVDAPQLAESAGRARALAARTPCDAADLKTVAGRAENAFAGWKRLARLTLPGARRDWSADRFAYQSPTYRLVQDSVTGASPVRFGLAGTMDAEDAPLAVVSWFGRPRPVAARLVLRDAGVAPQPWLTGDLPPSAQARTIWSSGAEDAATTLLPRDRKTGQAWRFPAEAAEALATLDPREPFALEFLFRDGSVARARFEAGDFAAGQAFLAMGAV